MNNLFIVAVYALSVWFSRRMCMGYWYVGPIFALTACAVNPQILRKISMRHLIFFAAAILTYALVYGIASHGWDFKADWLDMLAGSVTGGVVVGSIIMPSIHAMIFGIDSKTAGKTALYLIISWYLVNIASLLDDRFNLDVPIDYLLVAIALWQGIYLKNLKLT